MSLGLFLAVVAGGAPVDQAPITTIPANAMLQADGTPFLQSDGSYFLLA